MTGVDLGIALARILCKYRNAPQPSGLSPSELLLGYKLRTRLDMCFPPRNRTAHQREPTDNTTWSFAPGDTVYVRNYGVGDKWTPGKVKSTTGARLVTVQTDEGVVRRHTEQVRKCSTDTTGTPPAEPLEDPMPREERAPDSSTASDGAEAPPQLRRSARTKKPVERYGY